MTPPPALPDDAHLTETRVASLELLRGNFLHAMRDTTDGFRLAETDLKLRGPGELLGTRQTGTLEMRFADLARDVALLPIVRTAAERLLAEHPDRVDPLLDRWMPGRERYAEA
jgi:ATP-dependent DNA helicase RecG